MVIIMDKEILIEKIADSVGMNDGKSLNQTKNTALKVASQMLKVAAEKQRQLELQIAQSQLEIAKLSSEIEGYRREKDGFAKQALAEEISNNMFEKGLIKKSDIDSKSKELAGMEMTALEVFGNTISSIPEKTAGESVSDLTFLCGNNNIKEKETMAGAINSFIV